MLGALLGLFESIGLTFEGDDLAIVGEAIDQGDDASGVGEDLVPFGERTVRGYDGALLLVAAVGELEEQIGMAVGVREVATSSIQSRSKLA